MTSIQKLHKFLIDHYSLQELYTLCLDLSINFENLAGSETLDAKARALILEIGRQNRFEELLEVIEQNRVIAFTEKKLKNNEAFLHELYTEVERFEATTRPIQERLLYRISSKLSLGFILIVILIVIASGIALYSLFVLRGPGTMSGHFRIAVAEFEEIGDSGRAQIGRVLAEDAFLQLQKSFEALNIGFVITLWGPEQVGEVKGQTSDERASDAAILADRIEADMIIYGAVNIGEDGWFALPEFYIAETNFYQAEEITGRHELGAPFSIAGQGNIAGRIRASEEMVLRTRVLAQIIVGLSYHAIEDFEEAIESYLLIEEIEDWENREDYPIIPLLLGNAAAKNEDLDVAEQYYQSSVELDPEYARGYLGVANLQYRRALEPFEKTGDPLDTDQALLSSALETLEMAEMAKNQSSSADISVKIHFERGQIYFMQVYSGLESSFAASANEFNAVIVDYNDGANPRIRELAAEAHARLALIYDLTGNPQKAAEEYGIAASLLPPGSERRTIYEQRAQKIGAQSS